MATDTDRFGNRFAPNLSYARGKILAATADDFTKLQRAWAIIRERGPEAIYIFTGLDHSLPMEPEDLRWADDEIAPALHWDRLKALTLEHLGGTAPAHDIAVFNRLTGATLATHLTLVKPGDAVIGVSAATATRQFSARRHTSGRASLTRRASKSSSARSIANRTSPSST